MARDEFLHKNSGDLGTRPQGSSMKWIIKDEAIIPGIAVARANFGPFICIILCIARTLWVVQVNNITQSVIYNVIHVSRVLPIGSHYLCRVLLSLSGFFCIMALFYSFSCLTRWCRDFWEFFLLVIVFLGVWLIWINDIEIFGIFRQSF